MAAMPARDETHPASPDTEPADELVIPNRLDEVGRATTWLHAFADRLALTEEMRYRLDTGLNEAVTNVVSYAFADGAEHLVRLRLSAEGGAVRLDVEDDGIPFDPLRTEDRQLPTRIEDAPIGGLGIQLMRSMLDECRYRREGGRNHLTLIARPRGRADRAA